MTTLVGCTDPPGDDDPTASEGRTITAHDELTLRAADGSRTELPTDLDAAVVQVVARDESGAWHAFPGEGTSTGALRVAGVPAGGGWLRVDYFDGSPEGTVRNEYFWIDGDGDLELDLGTWRFGRADVEHATTVPTMLDLHLRDLDPWRPERDVAVIYEPNTRFVQAFTQDGEGISGMPALQETEAHLQVDWASALAAPLLDSTRGDHAYGLQLRFVQMGGLRVGAAMRSAVLPALTQRDGVATSTEVPFTNPTPLLVRVAMDTDAFDALRPAIGVAASGSIGRGFAVLASPSDVATEFSPTSLPAELLQIDDDFSAEPSFDFGDRMVSSPFARENLFAQFASGYFVPVDRDDGLTADAFAEVGVMTPVLPTEGAPASPLVGPVRDITIGGKPAFGAPSNVGVVPEVTWQPPTLGTATEYEVSVLAPGGADPRYGFLWYPAAVFHVPGAQTSLALPPEVIVDGQPYAIAIRAISNALPAEQRAAAPRHRALPYGWADTITPAFKP